jgi:benzaldehyde dehydrogenase (NAD)
MTEQSGTLGVGRILASAPWSARVFDGDWVSSRGGSIDVSEPATGQLLTRVGVANAADIAAASRQAALAQPGWLRVAAREREQVFHRAAGYLEQNGEELARFIARETGGTWVRGQREVCEAVAHLKAAAGIVLPSEGVVLPSSAGRMNIAQRVPLGVLGVISPFNFPLLSSMRSVAPALAAGNAVVLQPDAQTAVTGGYIVALAFEAAGLPGGLLHVLPGDGEASEALCADPNVQMIAFTGSMETGRRVAEIAGRHLKKVALDLAGKSALVVLDDADLELATRNVTWEAHLHQGQVCMATERVLVHERVAAALTDRLVARVRHRVMGDPARGNRVIGLLLHERQRDRVHSIVSEAIETGAQPAAGGGFEGLLYAPTVLSAVRPSMRAFSEEIFGPVACITTFGSDEEAIALANGAEHGPSAGIISSSIGRARAIAERLDASLVVVNDATRDDESTDSFGATAAADHSHGGGPADVGSYTRWRWMTLEDSAAPHRF